MLKNMRSDINLEKHMPSGISLGKKKKKKTLVPRFFYSAQFSSLSPSKNTFWDAFLNNTSFETGRITIRGTRMGIGL